MELWLTFGLVALLMVSFWASQEQQQQQSLLKVTFLTALAALGGPLILLVGLVLIIREIYKGG